MYDPIIVTIFLFGFVVLSILDVKRRIEDIVRDRIIDKAIRHNPPQKVVKKNNKYYTTKKHKK